MTPNIEYIAEILGDYCNLQIDGIVPAANRYPVADVMEQVGLLEHLQPVANEVLARRIAELERQLSEQTALVFDLTAERDTAWRELREIRVAIGANPEESTADEVQRVVAQKGSIQNAMEQFQSQSTHWHSEAAVLAAQVESLTYIAKELSGCIAEYEKLGEKSLRQAMFNMNCRLQPRINQSPTVCLAQVKADAVEAAIKFCNHHMAFPVNHGKIADRVIAVSELIMYAERIRQGGAA